jgi:hypothetical protein
MKRVMTILTALTISALLTACAGAAPPKIVSSGCLIFKPITYANAPRGQERADDPGNRFDTPETIAEIDEHMAVWERVCAR